MQWLLGVPDLEAATQHFRVIPTAIAAFLVGAGMLGYHRAVVQEESALLGLRLPSARRTLGYVISALGLARALSTSPRVKEIVEAVQRELMLTVSAELATDPGHYETMKSHFAVVTPAMVEQLEHLIDELKAEVDLPRAFIVPGASAASSALDLGRTILRRAERRTVALKQAGLLVNDEVLRYLNRLSDLLFMLARYEDRDLPMEQLPTHGKK